ncbi:hypothetical protein [Gryllotalpicola protaetiae]|uniref:Uncharacterized protein n=1 Tax=Gryllotalpicola protaetiae TaxID=2419771 RepID=A0A387BS72_9MICO|nr:hypothetical protein [Gryllotalpicola protaetiae]AYG05548.1 hypothetical protein D7I44_17885 [Gryllotalpicola protaetiae]
MHLHSIENATVWTVDELPVRMVWRGHRWRVTDTPTPLLGEVYHELLTHPALSRVGWRFQVTDEAEETHVVDAEQAGDAWAVVAVYD